VGLDPDVSWPQHRDTKVDVIHKVLVLTVKLRWKRQRGRPDLS